MAMPFGLGPKLGACVPSGFTASSMRRAQLPTSASFIDFGGPFGAALAAAAGRCWAFWACPGTGSTSTSATAIMPSVLCRFIVFPPSADRCAPAYYDSYSTHTNRRQLCRAVSACVNSHPALILPAWLCTLDTFRDVGSALSEEPARGSSEPRGQVGEPLRGSL